MSYRNADMMGLSKRNLYLFHTVFQYNGSLHLNNEIFGSLNRINKILLGQSLLYFLKLDHLPTSQEHVS